MGTQAGCFCFPVRGNPGALYVVAWCPLHGALALELEARGATQRWTARDTPEGPEVLFLSVDSLPKTP